MKRNFKKLSSLLLALLLVFSISVPAFAVNVSQDRAKEIALEYFKVEEKDVKFFEARKDYDDGVAVYEFEFCKPYSMKYSCEVVAANGRVKDAEREHVISFWDKIELFFEVLLWKLFKR